MLAVFALARRHRTYVLLSILTLVLCIGANTIVFTIVNALWIRPQPVHDPTRVVVVLHRSQKADGSRFSELALNRLRSIGLFSQVAGQVVTRGTRADLAPRVAFRGRSEITQAIGVTSDYFSVLGVAVRGRDFAAADDAQAAALAVISDRLWRREFDSNPDVLGATVDASPRPLQIVGIAPPGFHGALRGEDIDLWLPRNLLQRLVAGGELREGPVPMINFCRLQQGVSIEAASAWFAQGQRPSDLDLQVVPIDRLFGAPDLPMVMVGDLESMALVLAIALLVLVGGCITLAALVIVHYERRRQELGTRIALGATVPHLVRQLAGELVIWLCPGVLGAVGLSVVVIRTLPSLSLPSGVDLARLNLSTDWRVITLSVLLAIVVSLTALVIPLARFVRGPHVLIQTSTASRGSLTLRRAILAVHSGATLLALIAAGLFVQAVMYGFTQAPGFDVDRTLFVTVQTRSAYDEALGVPGSSERDAAASVALVEQLSGLPSVEAVAFGAAPLGPDVDQTLDRDTIILTDEGEASLPLAWRSVGPNYLEAIGVPLLLGHEGESTEAVVTPSLANSLWPDGSALGRRLRLGGMRTTVVGVSDLALGSIQRGRPAGVITYDLTAKALPGVLSRRPILPLTIRSSHPDSIREPIDRVVRESLPDSLSTRIVSGRELVSADLGRERLGALFFSGFAVITLVLGVVSIYGLVAYLAESRRREFGVMLSLGASHASVTLKAMWAAVGPVAIGAATGSCVAVVLADMVESMIYGVHALSPKPYITAWVLFIACAAGAAYVATYRLRKLEIMDALRTEC